MARGSGGGGEPWARLMGFGNSAWDFGRCRTERRGGQTLRGRGFSDFGVQEPSSLGVLNIGYAGLPGEVPWRQGDSRLSQCSRQSIAGYLSTNAFREMALVR